MKLCNMIVQNHYKYFMLECNKKLHREKWSGKKICFLQPDCIELGTEAIKTPFKMLASVTKDSASPDVERRAKNFLAVVRR